MYSKEELKEAKRYGSITYYEEVKRDLLSEPQVVCEFDKRRKCDSQYISMYNNLLKAYNKLLKQYTQALFDIDQLKQLRQVEREAFGTAVENIKIK